jgi:protease PrsW
MGDDIAMRQPSRRWWRGPWGFFVGGFVLWLASVIVTYTTENPTLVPTVILIGSFLVPLTFVLWAFDSGTEVLTVRDVVFGFFVGGVLGVLGASVLESSLIDGSRPLLQYVGVGLIEEFVKIAVVVGLAWHLPRYTLRDGAIFGAAVGFGFAAFESSGYAFNAALTQRGIDLRSLVETEILRGLLAPVGHGLWTAILAAVLFRASAAHPRLRVSGSVVGWYLVVSLLHAFWDLSGGLAALITWFFTAQTWQVQLVQQGRIPAPSEGQRHLYTVLSWGFLIVESVVALLCLRHVLSSARRYRRNMTGVQAATRG